MSDAKTLQRLVQDAMDGILVHHDRAGVSEHFHPDFVQHNPWAADGGAHVEEMCNFTFGVEMRRWVIQGDLVAYHGLYTAPNPLGEYPLLCVDIWRVQGGRIVEHWDALMPVPPAVAEIMLAGDGDGLADVAPTQVAANAANARRLWELGVRRGDSAFIRGLLASSFSRHRLDVVDGRQDLLDWVHTHQPRVEVRKSVSSGDLVLLQLLVEIGGVERVVYDLYRFDEEGRITDQWTVEQDRSPLSAAGNPHPHF